MKKLMLVLLAGAFLMTSSCTKEGAQGPQGPQGVAGVNTSVIGEDPFTVSTWTLSGNSYSATFSDPNLTSDVYNYGLFEIYKLYSTLGWTNLPDANGVTTTVYNFRPGSFDIYVYNTDGTTPAYPGTVTFRAVVIPSTVRQANPTTNWTNYIEATKALAAVKTVK